VIFGPLLNLPFVRVTSTSCKGNFLYIAGLSFKLLPHTTRPKEMGHSRIVFKGARGQKCQSVCDGFPVHAATHESQGLAQSITLVMSVLELNTLTGAASDHNVGDLYRYEESRACC
jgi:hypothetical protein